MQPSSRAALLSIFLTACGAPNARLADLQGRAVSIHGAVGADGNRSLEVALDYTSSPVRCAVLGSLEVTLNGVRFDQIKPGEWRDTTLAGSAAYCVKPSFSMTSAHLPADGSAALRIADDSAAISVEVPRLGVSGGLTIATPEDGHLHSSATVTLAHSGDTDAPLSAYVEGSVDETGSPYCQPGKSCFPERAFLVEDLALSDQGFSFVVPDLVKAEVHPALVAGTQSAGFLKMGLSATPAVTSCAGAEHCSVTMGVGQWTFPVTLIP